MFNAIKLEYNDSIKTMDIEYVDILAGENLPLI